MFWNKYPSRDQFEGQSVGLGNSESQLAICLFRLVFTEYSVNIPIFKWNSHTGCRGNHLADSNRDSCKQAQPQTPGPSVLWPARDQKFAPRSCAITGQLEFPDIKRPWLGSGNGQCACHVLQNNRGSKHDYRVLCLWKQNIIFSLISYILIKASM